MPEGQQFEASGNLADWPENVPGKPTRVAVFGLLHSTKGRKCEILWTGEFPDLDQAIYWGAKKEIHALRKLKWSFASRVVWQHDLTAERAVDVIRQQMTPQIDRLLQQQTSDAIDLGPGLLKPINPNDVQGYYVEFDDGAPRDF
jgi:hypothetical protein